MDEKLQVRWKAQPWGSERAVGPVSLQDAKKIEVDLLWKRNDMKGTVWVEPFKETPTPETRRCELDPYGWVKFADRFDGASDNDIYV